MVQLSHDYWKTITLATWTFDGRVMSLVFNMLFRLVIAFLPRSKGPYLGYPLDLNLEENLKTVIADTANILSAYNVPGAF